jgi:hypothetical protein
MPCKETTNCAKFPDYPCYDTEKECKCKCPDSGLDPDSDECKCIEEEKECVGGRIRKRDCQCFCGSEKYLEDGVCYRYEYSCDGQQCFEVRGAGQYKNWADCGLNCGGGPPPCFPIPMPPVGKPLLCPNGRQYGLVVYIYNPIQCRYEPRELIWFSCDNPPPLPSSDPSSTPGGSSGSAEPECDCVGSFSGMSNSFAQVCGQQVPTMVVTPSCNGGFRTFEWCDECGCDNQPTLKQQQLYVFRETNPYTGEQQCSFEYIPLPPNIGGPFPCPAACPASSSSTVAESSSSSAPCQIPENLDDYVLSANISVETSTGPEQLPCDTGTINLYINGTLVAARTLAADPARSNPVMYADPINIILPAGITPNLDGNYIFSFNGAGINCDDNAVSWQLTLAVPGSSNPPAVSDTVIFHDGTVSGGTLRGGPDVGITDGAFLVETVFSCDQASSSSSGTCGVTGPTTINFSGSTQTGAPLNDFGQDDYAEVVIYAPTGLQQARDAETKWTFYVVYPNPTTSPTETPTRYNITDGDFSADEWPSFILTSEMLLDVLDLNFGTAPNGSYPFQLCAEAVNCAGLYDTKCAANGIVVKVTDNPNASSSSTTSAGNSSSSSGIAAPSSSSSSPIAAPSSSSSSSARICNPAGPNSSRVLYFVGGGCPNGNSVWARLQNWREVATNPDLPPIGNLCDECVPASLPDSTDTVILRHSITQYSETASNIIPDVRRLVGLSTVSEHGLFISASANTSAEFGGLFYIGRDQTASPPRVGQIEAPNSLVTFKGAASNSGRVLGTAVFTDNTLNNADGEITCGATFNNASRRLDTNKISGTIVCNTTAVPCSTVANSAAPTYCPNLSAGLTVAGLTVDGVPTGVRYAAVAYTNQLPPSCVTPPAGWQQYGNRFVKLTDEVTDILDCQFKLWDLKNEIGLFRDGTYRVSAQCDLGSWYAVPLNFGYMVLGYGTSGTPEFTHILDEQTFQQD